jgi:hypothetical protein
MTILTRVLPFLLIASAALAASPAPSASAASRDNLDQKRIHSDYNDGNFEKVVAALEGYMSAHSTYSFQDSVFIAKHLAVVYSANPDTREKGKYYMYRLLTLLPSAKLVDMYVSDEIDRIFDKVREEFVGRQRGFGVDTARIAVPEKAPTGSRGKDPAPPAKEPPSDAQASASRKGHAGLWIAGGAAVAAAGLATAYFLLQGEEQPQPVDRVYRVPGN